ncbi:MAG: ABC transporter permease [Acidobacteriota bacterium]|nr:ABC transporter permease [Acidobacteriota bacterium]
MDGLIQDIRYGIRQLVRQRGSSLVAVLTLALGIGVSTAIFSVIDATMLRPLPYPNPEQLVTVGPALVQPDGTLSRPTASMEDMRTWQAATDVFTQVAGRGSAFRGRIADGPEPERLQVTYFTEEYLPMHAVTPILGRGFLGEDSLPSSPLVALLGHGYWRSHYGGASDVIGKTIRLDDEIATIVGVLPEWFDASTPVATPLRVSPQEYARRGTGRVSVYARLRPDVTIDQARERLSARMPAWQGRDGSSREVRAHLTSRLESATRSYRTTVNVLAGAVALILLIAGVNVSGLLLARGAVRQSELAVRASLGAGRGRLIRQLLTESVVLAIPGGLLGVLLAWVSLDLIVANIPLSLPSNSPVTLNLKVLAATVALLVPTALLFGLAPALRLSRVRINSVLAQGGRQGSSTLSRRGSQVLIAAEIALAVVLVAGAALMIRSFMRISAVDLGFEPDGLVTMEVLPLDRDPAAHRAYYAGLLRQLRTVPGIASAGIVNNFPLGGATMFSSVTVAGKGHGTTMFQFTPGYFEAIGATLRDGRLPTDGDYASGLRGVVINESAARLLFPEGPAAGRELGRGNEEPWTVLGVVADLRHGGPLATTEREPRTEAVYFPLEPTKYDLNTAMLVVVRPARDAAGLAERLRHAAQSVGPRVLIERIRTGDELFGADVITPRRRTVLLGLLGGLGLTLALVGVFGMTAYAVARRTAEIGVRMAFGASPWQVVRVMLTDAAVPIAIGILFGVGSAVLATRIIESFLFETAPRDPVTLAAVALTLAAAGCLAALIPALRAAKVDPATCLRAG